MEDLVLVVEDDPSIQFLLQEALTDGGFRSARASSGEEALALLNGTKCDILVIDVSFGNDHINGWDVARRARAINPALHVIYITGSHGHEWARQGVSDSVLLIKPFAPAQLVNLVSRKTI